MAPAAEPDGEQHAGPDDSTDERGGGHEGEQAGGGTSGRDHDHPAPHAR